MPHKTYRVSQLVLLMVIPLSLTLANKPATALQKPVLRDWVKVWDWTNVPWNGDNKPYQQIRATIDNAIAARRKPQDLAFFYEGPALRDPSDPQAQFKWAYATYRVALTTDQTTGDNMLDHPLQALVLAPFPKTYEYARLIFLAEDHTRCFITNLQAVSKRIVRINPKDRDVKYAAARNLIYSTVPVDRNLSYKYAAELLTQYPDWATPYGLEGFIFYKRWQNTKSKADGDKAIEEYQQCLQLDTLPDNDFRKRVQEVITEIQKG